MATTGVVMTNSLCVAHALPGSGATPTGRTRGDPRSAGRIPPVIHGTPWWSWPVRVTSVVCSAHPRGTVPRHESTTRSVEGGRHRGVRLRRRVAGPPPGGRWPRRDGAHPPPDRYTGAGAPVAADVGDAGSLRPALAGHDAAYYLVHSLADADFAEQGPRRGATPSPPRRATPG